MQIHKMTVRNPLGLHESVAAKLAALSSRYTSSVELVANGRRANARHFIAVLTLSVGMGTPVSIQISGPDEAEAMREVTHLIGNGIGEG
jgi:phosphocarrier protein